MAGKSLYPNAVNHQVDLEWPRSHRRGHLAVECFRIPSVHLPDSRWNVRESLTALDQNGGSANT